MGKSETNKELEFGDRVKGNLGKAKGTVGLVFPMNAKEVLVEWDDNEGGLCVENIDNLTKLPDDHKKQNKGIAKRLLLFRFLPVVMVCLLSWFIPMGFLEFMLLMFGFGGIGVLLIQKVVR